MQVDSKVNKYILLGEVINHWNNISVLFEIKYFMPTNGDGNRYRNPTTKGWKPLFTCKYGSFSWNPIKDLKESNPFQISGCVVINKIGHEPYFYW